MKEDDDDLESLSAELRTLAPNVRVDGLGKSGKGPTSKKAGAAHSPQGSERTHSSEMVGVARSDGLNDFRGSSPSAKEEEQGIMKTVSLDVRQHDQHY